MIKKVIKKLSQNFALLKKRSTNTKHSPVFPYAIENLLGSNSKNTSLITPAQERLIRTQFTKITQ